MPFITIAGQQLHYQTRGSGFPVLLGHSYLWDSAMWQPQIEALSQSYQVIVPELWGHGQSGPMPESTRTFGDLAAQASELLDALNIEQCAMIGLSLGGMWGSELALREPKRIKALVIMDSDRGAEPAATLAQYTQMVNTIESLGQIPAPMIDAIAPLYFRRGAPLDSELIVSFKRALAAFSADQLRQSIVPLGRLFMNRADEVAKLAALDASTTLVMGGELDIPRPPAEAIRMAETIGCRHVLVPEAGHISCLENPSFVNRELLAFLDQHVGANA
ncbi:alpha/beta fold hydrolase [Paraburkholderia rhizosphaerae]|uniref:Pimeloyl-ACP methyl ester carboxylesterase n=1 Tax=Paraburkholderia rhizosphaerae TaxID=480658 RepID=A0A4R8M4N5_9BURK|nr:alpha/beta hydrolase [Paraburkholderia rhizosphaerae]TDY54941.1 pimeloyl-ACP methyl ester carboxylesterase [Paraburkholderia rhizosphaerae]